MDKKQKTFEELLAQSKKITLLQSISQLLEWDQETYMPEGGAKPRAEQQELMASLIHKEKISKSFGKQLSQFIDLDTGTYLINGLNRNQKAMLREWRRNYLQAICLPTAFVKKFTRISSESMNVWANARRNDDFKSFAPYLKQIIEMSRQKAEYLGYQEHIYDALLDLYEPGAKTKQIDKLFKDLSVHINAILQKILKSPQVNDSFIHGKFSVDKQLEFGELILEAIGYDLNKGRLDLSNHPFSMSLHPNDSRITTRIHKTSLLDCTSAVLHEAGHSLYEMGLPVEHFGNPLCESISLGIHESQSRFWETRIGQSKPFWTYFFPILQKMFSETLKKIDLEQFYRGINKVQPGLIRIEADEVTYSLHVILRFEMEKELIEGSLDVEDIPEAWNSKIEKYLGIIPQSDSEGCLQDIHWSMGGFGYFPTYTLGNLYASQMFEVFEADHTDWENKIADGHLIFVKEWLNTHIHQHGKLYSAQDLIKKVTGHKLSIEPFISYLKDKYSKIYP